jgi:diaminopimelate decarboxylase
MASNYNRLPRPAVVAVRGGDARAILRRETDEDQFRLEVAL